MGERSAGSIQQTRKGDYALRDPVNAFCTHGPLLLQGKDDGSLTGLHFAAKDLLDVQGYVTGCGNPDWLKTHRPATKSASTINALVDAGACMVAKAHTDELAYSLNGENAHYGTPINSRAPGRVPGGSSSGSAAAVAASLVDFALGTDTGGSVRVPASYCGVYGFRPTHGRVDMAGCMPLAPSLDTIGWFADLAKILTAVGEVLLKTSVIPRRCGELLVAADLFEESDEEIREVCKNAVNDVQTMYGFSRSVYLSSELDAWANALRTILGAEAWQSHREWITAFRPEFGPGVRERFAWASSISEQQLNDALVVRQRAIEHMGELLRGDRILVMPTTPCAALQIDMPQRELEAKRTHVLNFTCIAGLCGLPQVTLPLCHDSFPAGLSLLGPRHSDETLLGVAELIEGAYGASRQKHLST